MRLPTLFNHLRQTLLAYAGDTVLTQAGLSAAANVIVADGEVSTAEFETALAGVLANPIVRKGYDHLMLEHELFEAVGRARTRAGRVENLRRAAAAARRPIEQRQDVFLVAADVADQDGISEIEHRALGEIASALQVDAAALMRIARVRPAPQPTAA